MNLLLILSWVFMFWNFNNHSHLLQHDLHHDPVSFYGLFIISREEFKDVNKVFSPHWHYSRHRHKCLFSKTNISQNLWTCLISIEGLKQNARENMFLTVADVLRSKSISKKYIYIYVCVCVCVWDVSLNDTGEQFKSLAWDFSNWDLRVYSRELEGLQEYFFV